MAIVYRIAGLGRLPLGTPYPGVVSFLVNTMRCLPPATPLLVDYSGVGRGIYDTLVDAGLSPVGVTITGGVYAMWHNCNTVTVPKSTLVSKLVAIAHSGELQIHERLKDWPALRRKMENFRPELTRSGRALTFNAAPGSHDDLLIAAALEAWYLQRSGRPGEDIFEYYRRAAGAGGERHCVAADIGQAADPTAVCFMTRVELAHVDDAPGPGFRPAGALAEAVAFNPALDRGPTKAASDNRSAERRRLDEILAGRPIATNDVPRRPRNPHQPGSVEHAKWEEQQQLASMAVDAIFGDQT